MKQDTTRQSFITPLFAVYRFLSATKLKLKISVNIRINSAAIIALTRHTSSYVPQLFQKYPKMDHKKMLLENYILLRILLNTIESKKLYHCKRLHTLILVEGVQSVRSCTRAGKILEKFRLTNVRQPRFKRSCSIEKNIIALSKWLFRKVATGVLYLTCLFPDRKPCDLVVVKTYRTKFNLREEGKHWVKALNPTVYSIGPKNPTWLKGSWWSKGWTRLKAVLNIRRVRLFPQQWPTVGLG